MTHRGRLATVASTVLFAYLLVWMVELSSLGSDDDAFNQLQEWSATLAGRLVACLVWTAAVYHGLEGARAAFHVGTPVSVAAGEGVGDGVDDEHAAGGAFGAGVIAFLSWALIIPGWVLLLRPWIEDLLR
jgi:succinate dehydrogenase/fumarate reductase cytochrome b subunit